MSRTDRRESRWFDHDPAWYRRYLNKRYRLEVKRWLAKWEEVPKRFCNRGWWW